MAPWLALAIALAFVFVGTYLQKRAFQVWQMPRYLEKSWVRYSLMLITIVLLGFPSVSGYGWVSPIYGTVIGFLGGRQADWEKACKED
ncbi:MAG: hypothetical protein M1294_12880 [Firmicutes bacterium]|jgi:hypothetical protein|uniref:Uncharacterized protein n=1 Tax=Sulfobacillus benefaciens TaxID=453960 RepID=A0A2T2WZT3_9FIRM|nr:hypothetical protein [Bacillota bacterium]MCL5013603.1 hypothetical protein [Bacillota bacterium]PSR27745.1 MAG: hypothetical protein C7B43_11100 [Sulfobacillus benefaciens]HBQ94183.1 hypothetical protein [Sulfobacillus sp.]